jgi:prolyl oligopeptidase
MGGIYAHYVPSEGLYLFNCTWNKDWTIYYYNPENSTITQKDIYPLGPYSHAPQLIIKEVEVPLSDGTLVPLTIVYSNKIKLNADNPTILTGYGSYGYNYSPSFSQTLLAWYENGGIFAVAHVRGGGEKGDAWYQGGFKSTKPNSWKDFIACAEYLIKNNYTSPKKLAAEGSSAGGITVGMAIIERPELFKAAYISYGAVNQLRDEFTSNTLGVTEFGSIKDSIEVKYLYNMDVYQHINSQSNYPSVLFTTAMKDSRVAFWQPAKAAARMQSVSKGDNLVLLRISEEGHWGESDAIDEEADKYSFLFWQLGHPQFQNNAVPKNKPID